MTYIILITPFSIYIDVNQRIVMLKPFIVIFNNIVISFEKKMHHKS